MIDLIPTDITELSFWAARQIPTSETFKARILAESSPERRLMVILNINYWKHDGHFLRQSFQLLNYVSGKPYMYIRIK